MNPGTMHACKNNDKLIHYENKLVSQKKKVKSIRIESETKICKCVQVIRESFTFTVVFFGSRGAKVQVNRIGLLSTANVLDSSASTQGHKHIQNQSSVF